MENQDLPIEETERYAFLMEESMKQFPYACSLMVHVAVCSQIIEEAGMEVDENEVENYKNIYCKKLEYDDMISAE